MNSPSRSILGSTFPFASTRPLRGAALGLACMGLATACTQAVDDGADDTTTPSESALTFGQTAKPGQFPATVALLANLSQLDRFCITEDRRCTMTRVGPRAYLSAGHCFADGNVLETQKKVVRDARLENGKKTSISYGVEMWESVEGTCAQTGKAGTIWRQHPQSKRVSATIRNVYFHPSYLTGGAEAGTHVEGSNFSLYNHADVAILEVAEDFKGFADIANVSFAPLKAADPIIIGGHGGTGGFTGGASTILKFAPSKVDTILGQDFFTAAVPFKEPAIQPGDSGGPVYLASDKSNHTVVGVNSKTSTWGSAHVRMDDGTQQVRAWYEKVMAQIGK
jgi:hypothetical protein